MNILLIPWLLFREINRRKVLFLRLNIACLCPEVKCHNRLAVQPPREARVGCMRLLGGVSITTQMFHKTPHLRRKWPLQSPTDYLPTFRHLGRIQKRYIPQFQVGCQGRQPPVFGIEMDVAVSRIDEPRSDSGTDGHTQSLPGVGSATGQPTQLTAKRGNSEPSSSAMAVAIIWLLSPWTAIDQPSGRILESQGRNTSSFHAGHPASSMTS